MTYAHFAVFPSANVSRGIACAEAWRLAGYQVLVGFDRGVELTDATMERYHCMALPVPFPGYYAVINDMVRRAFDLGADVVTALGDDMLPVAEGAMAHAAMYFRRFPQGDGVMQCTGDRQGELIGGKCNSERICGSPTFARPWFDRFGFPSGFKSFYCDEAILLIAQKHGNLYQEPALKIDHAHWSFGRTQRQPYHAVAQKNWDEDKAHFERMFK